MFKFTIMECKIYHNNNEQAVIRAKCRHNKLMKQIKMGLDGKMCNFGRKMSKNERKMRENEIRRLDCVGETCAVELKRINKVAVNKQENWGNFFTTFMNTVHNIYTAAAIVMLLYSTAQRILARSPKIEKIPRANNLQSYNKLTILLYME